MNNLSSKNSFISSHDLRFELDTNINELMRIDTDLGLSYGETKWKSWLWSAFQLKIHFNLTRVNNPELFLNTIRILRRNQVLKVKGVFFDWIYVSLDDIMKIDSSGQKRVSHNLFFKNRFVIFGFNRRHTGLSNQHVKRSL